MRAPRMGVEGVKSAPASIGATNPLRADERREPACWARDIAAAFREVEDSLFAIHRGTSMRPANAAYPANLVLSEQYYAAQARQEQRRSAA